MPPEWVHFFPHCLHWRLNPVRHPSGLRISPVMASSPWHEHRGTILDMTLSFSRLAGINALDSSGHPHFSRIEYVVRSLHLGRKQNSRRDFSYSYMPCPLAHGV